ncbi:unnamed protein product [Symbiodinium sp. KB8]|nr:unnamed protein product [Symbiodinium sp. KB8]
MDSSRVSLVSLTLKESAFTDFKCESPAGTEKRQTDSSHAKEADCLRVLLQLARLWRRTAAVQLQLKKIGEKWSAESTRQTWKLLTLHQAMTCRKALRRTRCRGAGHRQCMEILVRQDCEQKCRKEHLEELKHKLREETQRREQLDLEVARLSVRSQVLKENAEKLVEEKNELKRRYDKLLTHSKRLDEAGRIQTQLKLHFDKRLKEKTSLKQKCDDQFKQLQELHLERLAEGLKEMLRLQGMEEEEWMQETATGSSRAEESAEESSVLSSEEASNAKDQDFRVTRNHLPEPVDPRLHTGVDLLGKIAEQHRMDDEESLQETAVGSLREEAAGESSVLSSEEVPHPTDQERPDSVPTPLYHLPEPVDPTLHTGVNLLSSFFLPFGHLAFVSWSPDCRAHFLARVGRFATKVGERGFDMTIAYSCAGNRTPAIANSRGRWLSPHRKPPKLFWCRPGCARSAGSVRDEKDEASTSDATPYRGRCSVEGVILPIADTEAPEEDQASSIDSRLSNRLQLKKSSQQLGSTEGPGMYAEVPSDRVEDKAKLYHVHESQDHLDAFQNVFRRLRRTGRDETDKDVSDSMLKAMEYARKKKEGG